MQFINMNGIVTKVYFVRRLEQKAVNSLEHNIETS